MTTPAIYINELSLDGQFCSLADFEARAMPQLVALHDETREHGVIIYRKSSLYAHRVTPSLAFGVALHCEESRILDGIRRYKKQLASLAYSEPFWDNNPCQNQDYLYEYAQANVNNTSIAEARATRQLIFSFAHSKFSVPKITVCENNEPAQLHNLTSSGELLEALYADDHIGFTQYCHIKFRSSRLVFEHAHQQYGLGSIPRGKEQLFIDTFVQFCRLEWTQLSRDSGLRYKPYHKGAKAKRFFKPEELQAGIMEFRVSDGTRCFGIKNNDKFHLLIIDLNHYLGD